MVTMDDIMILKEKHMKTADLKIQDLLQNQFELIKRLKNEAKQRCNEEEIKVNDLSMQVSLMRENLQAEKQSLEYKDKELAEYLDCIAQLEAERDKFLAENHSLELQRNKLKASKSNLHDEELLARGRRRFSLYKQLTGIRWDYERLKESITGYICNSERYYIHHFSYQTENTENVSNLLWDEIYKSVHAENKNIHEKENIVQNK